MKKPVVLRARADADLDAALEHFLVDAPAMASALLKSFEATIDAIGRAPALGSPRFSVALEIPGLRCRTTKSLPYLVFYIERDGDICVVRVLHQKRDIPAAVED